MKAMSLNEADKEMSVDEGNACGWRR